MTDDDIIRMNMLIHCHGTEVELLELSEKLVDYAVMLATSDDYDVTGFRATPVARKIVLRDSKIFLREKFVLHKVPYANESLLKLKLHGKLVRGEMDLLRLYNKVGVMKDPFDLPVNYVSQPYYYGNVSLLTNLSDNEDFLRNMKLLFKSIDLGEKTNLMSSVCYVHEIVHTQLESLKGIVREYYNSELLSIFLELLYALEHSEELYRETLKNRINLFLIEFHSLYNYVINGVVPDDGKWYIVVACKYIVSTLKAFNLLNKYIQEDELGKSDILWMIQKVFSGNNDLEEILNKLNVTYDNSLDYGHVKTLLKRKGA